MIHLLSLPLTALVSALHGWGKFPKLLSPPLLAAWCCYMLYEAGCGVYSLAGCITALLWWRTCRTGRIAKKEQLVLNPETPTSRLDATHEYKYALLVITLSYVVLAICITPLYALMVIPTLLLVFLHQYLMNEYFANYSYFTAKKYYDPTGKKFLDLRRISELSGGLFIGGNLTYSCNKALIVLISGM